MAPKKRQQLMGAARLQPVQTAAPPRTKRQANVRGGLMLGGARSSPRTTETGATAPAAATAAAATTTTAAAAAAAAPTTTTAAVVPSSMPGSSLSSGMEGGVNEPGDGEPSRDGVSAEGGGPVSGGAPITGGAPFTDEPGEGRTNTAATTPSALLGGAQVPQAAEEATEKTAPVVAPASADGDAVFKTVFFPNVTRAEAEAALQKSGVGTFLFRPTSQANCLAALSKHAPPPLGICHFLVTAQNDAPAGGRTVYALADSLDEQEYGSPDELVIKSPEIASFSCVYRPPVLAGAEADAGPLDAGASAPPTQDGADAGARLPQDEPVSVPGARAAFRKQFSSNSPRQTALQEDTSARHVSVYDFDSSQLEAALTAEVEKVSSVEKPEAAAPGQAEVSQEVDGEIFVAQQGAAAKTEAEVMRVAGAEAEAEAAKVGPVANVNALATGERGSELDEEQRLTLGDDYDLITATLARIPTEVETPDRISAEPTAVSASAIEDNPEIVDLDLPDVLDDMEAARNLALSGNGEAPVQKPIEQSGADTVNTLATESNSTEPSSGNGDAGLGAEDREQREANDFAQLLAAEVKAGEEAAGFESAATTKSSGIEPSGVAEERSEPELSSDVKSPAAAKLEASSFLAASTELRIPTGPALNTREGCLRNKSTVLRKLLALLKARSVLFSLGTKPSGNNKDLPKKIKMLKKVTALQSTPWLFPSDNALGILVEEFGLESRLHALSVLHALQVEGLVESTAASTPLDLFPVADKRSWLFAFDPQEEETAGLLDAPTDDQWAVLPRRFDGKPWLVVRVIEASNLITRDDGQACDPYVSISFGSQERRTSTVKKTFAPYFNEVVRLAIPDAALDDPMGFVRQTALSITVNDRKLLSDRRDLGQVLVSAAGLVRGRETFWKSQLHGEGVASGNIFVCLTAINFGHETAMVAAQARLLRGLNPRVDNKDEIVAALLAGADPNGVVSEADIAEAQADKRKREHANNMTADASANEPLCWSSDPSLQSALSKDSGIVSGTQAASAVAYQAPLFAKGVTALHLYSRREGGPGGVSALLQNNAEVEAVDSFGRTPLHFAAAFCSPTIAQLLISHGANVSVKDRGGRTPLHYAASFRVSSLGESNRVLDVILAVPNVDVGAVDNDGNTALHLAAAMGNQATARILLENGAKTHVKVKNARGKMALQEGLFDFLKPFTFQV